MTLDLPTLVVMQSFVLASAGVMLIFAWAQNRAVSALAIWGFANLLAAAGVLSLMFGATLRVPLCTAAGGVLLCTQSALIWKAARNIDGKRASWSLALVGAAAIIATGAVPLLRDFASAVGLAGGASYTAAVGLSVWAGRSDRLAARWALIGFAAVHSLSLWLGCVTTLTGSTGHDALPRLMSLFGFIYFESTIFTLGSAFFAIAWIKERNEAVSLVAARTDALTGIANRAAILENGDRALQRCRHDAAPTSIVMFDLDRFKSINDQHGHAVGDAVLRKFCDVTVSLLRPQDLFGRLGGEEFTVIMPGCSIEAAYARAERIRTTFADACRFIHGQQVKATVSAGVSVSETAAETLEALFESADIALYEAKAEGRDRVKRANRETAGGNISNVFRVA
jgi:diguanylate cyclase (GGDEF)-like protein